MTLAFLALAWLLGIAAAAFTGGHPAGAVAAASGLAALSFALRPRTSILLLAAGGALLVFAAGWRYEATRPPQEPAGIARYNDGPAVTFRALVDGEPEDRGSYRRYRLSVRQLRIDGGWRREEGGVLVWAAPFPRYRYGDLLEITGRLETPPTFQDFDYREYLLHQGITSTVSYPQVRLLERDQGSPFRAALIQVRARLASALADALPEPEAALAAGILLGTRSALPQDLREDMNATGTSHLVAVSGQNVTLVAGMVIALLAWAIGRRPAGWIALAGLIAYALLVGGQPPVVRAAIMGGLYIIAAALGRQGSAHVGLALAAAGMTAFDPQLVHDVSFQLSFAATLGLATLAPILRERAEAALARWPSLREFPLTQGMVELMAVTAAAIAFTIPIAAVNFQRVSLVAPLANLFAVPAFLGVAATAALAAALASLTPAGAEHLGWIAWPPAAYMAGVIRLFASVPAASIELRDVGTLHAIAYYGALGLAVWWLARRRPAPTQATPTAPPGRRALLPAGGLALLLALASALLWLAITAPVQGRLTVTFLDVGQGEAILIEGPRGHRILVDGGPSGEAIAAALGRRLPFYDRRIDLLILTHPQADHMGGLPTVMERYSVRGVLASPLEGESAAYRAFRDAVEQAGVPYTEAAAGQWIDLGRGARLHLLAPGPDPPPDGRGDPNAASVVIKVSMGSVSFLLTGDIDAQGEERLVRSGADLSAPVLKVAHHGSGSSSSPAFLSQVDPLIDIISVGADNRYGHPSPAVLERLEGDLLYRTDRHGDITISTDGQRLWVRTQRGP